jgi:hypothetical protein
MKKVSLLILLVIVLSTVVMAAVPTKTVRLTVINKSDFDVYIKLEGSEVTEAFYYLTIPAGSQDEPSVKVFTVMADLYSRETWQCNGVRSAGSLAMTGNIRLTFTPCGKFLTLTRRCPEPWVQTAEGQCLNPEDPTEELFYYAENQGEPTMEKVARFRWLAYGTPTWANADLYNGYWNWGCFTWYWRARTYSRPTGCLYRFQY